MHWVDLAENPERFTGYAGPSANKVWKAIYEENCFGVVPFLDPTRGTQSGGIPFVHLAEGAKSQWKGLLQDLQAPRDEAEEFCLEKRVYYRLVSGLHASISIHICDDYLDQKTGLWSPNLDCFISRIGQHPERLQNVYFDYVLMLRALAKAAPYLLDTDLCTGNDAEDAKTRGMVQQLLKTVDNCEPTFDERGMFSGPQANASRSLHYLEVDN